MLFNGTLRDENGLDLTKLALIAHGILFTQCDTELDNLIFQVREEYGDAVLGFYTRGNCLCAETLSGIKIKETKLCKLHVAPERDRRMNVY